MQALQKQMPLWYKAPQWLAGFAVGLHAIAVAAMAFMQMRAAWWLPVLEWVGIVAGGGFFLLTIVIFNYEHKKGWAVYAGILHAFLVAGVYYSQRYEWLPVFVAGTIYAVGIPSLMVAYVDIFESYKPGGHSVDVWQMWRTEVADFVNVGLARSGQALDTANAAADAARTVAGQAADIERMQAERAEMQALIAELGSRLAVLEAREAARAKDAERKRNERAKKSEETSENP